MTRYKNRGEIRCSGRGNIFWAACGTCRDVLYVVSRNNVICCC